MCETLSVSQYVLRYRMIDPEKVAIDEGENQISYHHLGLMVDNLSLQLRSRGVLVGDEVILLADDELLLLVGILSVSAVGGVSIVLRRSMLSPLLKSQLSELNPKFFLSDRNNIKLGSIAQIQLSRFNLTHPIGVDGFENPSSFDSVPLNSLFSLVIGSGSTGRPKIIATDNQQEISLLKSRANALNLSSADHVASMTHVEFTAARRNILSAFISGCTVKLYSKKDDSNIFKLICSDVTVLSVPVISLYALEKMYSGHGKIFPNLRVLSASGSVVGEDIRNKTDNHLTKNLHVIYGTNELGYLTIAKPENWRGMPGSIGRAIEGVEVQIVDANGVVVQACQPGLMRFRKKDMKVEYLNSQEFTSSDLRDGWFYPNDVGSMDEAGNIIFLGRADDMMIFNGINIYPAEIESCLLNMPGIQDAVALPVPHLVHQDVPVCAVVLQNGFSLDPSVILNWSRQMLGTVSPKHVFIVDNIPRDAQGKLMRPQLRELLISRGYLPISGV